MSPSCRQIVSAPSAPSAKTAPFPQGRLAQTVGLSRQALTSIEAGRATPSVEVALKIAATLSSIVEELFGARHGSNVEHVDVERDRRIALGEPLLVGWLKNRWVAHAARSDTLARSVDGVAAGPRRVALHRPKTELVDAVFVAGCAPALGALAERSQRKTGTLDGSRGRLVLALVVPLEAAPHARHHLGQKLLGLIPLGRGRGTNPARSEPEGLVKVPSAATVWNNRAG